ncbi:MAG TPA: glycosyltransferase [Thermoanaerobaculia bacterium]|nr:glycosyltransferase [Thermoanaerobaculia bacterium]
MAPQPEFSVVIPTRNEGARLAAAVRSIATGRSHEFPLEIVIIDDASSDGCCGDICALVESWPGLQATVVRLEQWSGIPYARNVGAKEAHADTLIVTDANVEFPLNWDLAIRRARRRNRVLCGTIVDQQSSFRGYGCSLEFPSLGVRWLRDPLAHGGYVPVAPCTCTVIAAALFARLGGYDDRMPVYGAAEPEFSVRMWLMGVDVVCLPELLIRHRFRPPSERAPFLDRIRTIQTHNYLRFGILYLSDRQLLQTMQHHALGDPDGFQEALQTVAGGDVWTRRELLRRSFHRSFGWYAMHFGLRDRNGRTLTDS